MRTNVQWYQAQVNLRDTACSGITSGPTAQVLQGYLYSSWYRCRMLKYGLEASLPPWLAARMT